jgi:hypothetical protein
MLRPRIAGVVLLVAAAVFNRAASQERAAAVNAPRTAEEPVVAEEPAVDKPMSIFNDKVCRFRFELEEMVITAETAEQFTVLHQARNQPTIIGAYADLDTNSLVVVGPADAEQPVRETLAKWMVESMAVGSPLNSRKRTLELRREQLLCEMADLEIQLVESGAEKAKQLRDRLQMFEDELAKVEKQIGIVDKYVQRLHSGSNRTVANTGVVDGDPTAPTSVR